MSQTIYLAEDEKNIRILVLSFLKKEGYHVHAFETGDALYEKFLEKAADLVILDIMMPGSSGFTICKKLRAISNVPIIMLTARDTDEDYTSGITLGSDAYFTKPFSPIKLTMQVKAMLRRVEMNHQKATSESNVSNQTHFLDITINHDKLTACCGNTELKLTHTEFALLSFLVANKERAVSREELLSQIWGYDAIIQTRATDDTIKRLRKKLLTAGSKVLINTVRGYGFLVGDENG